MTASEWREGRCRKSPGIAFSVAFTPVWGGGGPAGVLLVSAPAVAVAAGAGAGAPDGEGEAAGGGGGGGGRGSGRLGRRGRRRRIVRPRDRGCCRRQQYGKGERRDATGEDGW